MYLQAIDETSKSYSGGFGKWLHLGTSSPKDTDIVSPNNDSPYSYAWVDLRAEPWVLTLPKIEDKRFYTSQWDDLWGFVLDNPGSVEDGNGGVSVLLASPSWKGELPKGVKRVIQGESEFLGTLTRTQLFEPKDLPNVQKIQKEYKLQPLSAFLGQDAPEPRPRSSGWSGRTRMKRRKNSGPTQISCFLSQLPMTWTRTSMPTWRRSGLSPASRGMHPSWTKTCAMPSRQEEGRACPVQGRSDQDRRSEQVLPVPRGCERRLQ